MNAQNIWKRIVSDIKKYYILILLFIGFYIAVTIIFRAFCPFVIITGFPCAGCGMTRAVYYILTGRFEIGMGYNPSALFWIIWIIYFVIDRYVFGRSSKWVNRCLAVVCVITLGIYTYRICTQFPGNPPMIYYRENIFMKVLRYIDWFDNISLYY